MSRAQRIALGCIAVAILVGMATVFYVHFYTPFPQRSQVTLDQATTEAYQYAKSCQAFHDPHMPCPE